MKRIGIIIGIILVLGVVSLIVLDQPSFSTIETTFGTIHYDLVDSGITDVDNLVTTEVADGYFRYSIKSGADIRSVQPKTISIEDAPQGTSFGYSLAYYYDNDSITNEMVFLKFEIRSTDVRWDYVKVLTGSGSLIKQIDIEPKTGTATFFVFVDETELAGTGSIFIQFIGWNYALNSVVGITSYSELDYKVGPPLETTELTTTDVIAPSEDAPFPIIILPIAFLLLVIMKKQTKEE